MDSADRAGGNAGRRGVFPPARKLTDEQELEVARLYGETETPVGDIAGRFGIGESSVYRIAQRHGARLAGPDRAAGAARRGGRDTRAWAAAPGGGAGGTGAVPGQLRGRGHHRGGQHPRRGRPGVLSS
jgi:hypothetical protein